MAVTNGFSPANKNGDLLITDGANTLGFMYQEKTTMVEGRASTFTDNLNSGGTTYKDATPFARAVFDSWIGGVGQQSYNATFGGTGAGGDVTKYMDADAYTLRTGYLLPNMARNLSYNAVTASRTPISDGIDGFVGSGTITDIAGEFEVPRGITPIYIYNASSIVSATFTSSATTTVNNIRVLLYFANVPASSVSLTVTLSANFVNSAYSATITPTTILNQTGWKWYTFARTGGTGNLTSGFTNTISIAFLAYPAGLVAAVGGYVQDNGSGNNRTLAYFQLMTGSTPPKYWAAPPAKFEQLLNGTTYINVALTNGGVGSGTASAYFNTAVTNSGGTTPAVSPERTIGFPFLSSIVFNNTLYVSFDNGSGSFGVFTVSPANAATNAGATASDTVNTMYSPVDWNGNLYFINKGKNQILKWTGNFPMSGTDTPTAILGNGTAGTIGQSGSPMNGLVVLGGFLCCLKPEGIYQIFQQPEKIDPVEAPQINKLLTFPTTHPDTGKWFVIHQEMLFVNYRDVIYQCAFNTTAGTQINVLKPDLSRYRLNYYHYVNGLTSDGRNVYASWNNLGVYALSGQSWHKMFEFYETVSVESQSSGLKWLPNPTSAPDYLFCGDGRTVVQVPAPNAYKGINTQIFANLVNKCGYLMTSLWDGDVAEILKYIQAVTLRAKANNFRLKIVPYVIGPGDTSTDTNLLEKTFCEGLSRDSWLNWTPITSQPGAVATTIVDSGGIPVANTLAPACWDSTDFNNIFYSVEKNAFQTTDTTTTPVTTAILTNPSKFVETGFIIYFWYASAGMHNTVGQEIMAVDSISIKYLPILDYIPTYQCTIDFSSILDEGINSDTTATLGTYVAQLRAWGGRHSPVTIQFSDGYSGTNSIKRVNVLLRDIRFEYDPTVTRDDGGDPIPKRAFLSMVGIDAEYQGT